MGVHHDPPRSGEQQPHGSRHPTLPSVRQPPENSIMCVSVNVCDCMCVCMCMYACSRACVHARVRACVHLHVNVCLHARVTASRPLSTQCQCTCGVLACMYSCTLACVRDCLQADVYAYVLACMRAKCTLESTRFSAETPQTCSAMLDHDLYPGEYIPESECKTCKRQGLLKA